MNNDKLSYLAGIIDGEGTVTIHTSGTPYLTVTNTNKKLIDWIKNNFGGRTTMVKPQPNQKLIIVKWYMYGKEAIEILKYVFPWLIVKRENALILIDWELLKFPPRRGTKINCRNSISDIERKRRETLIVEIRKLNQKGRKK